MEKFGIDYNIDFHVCTWDDRKYLSEFFCGNESIDNYFNKDVQSDKSAITYLFIDTDADRLVACVTIACSAIFLEAEEGFRASTVLPAMEIKYFAVDEDYKHIPYIKGGAYTLSHYMFLYMLDFMKDISITTIGASKIVLYSVPKARNFYQRCRFKEFGSDMYGDQGSYLDGCIPMFFDLN